MTLQIELIITYCARENIHPPPDIALHNKGKGKEESELTKYRPNRVVQCNVIILRCLETSRIDLIKKI